MFNSLHEECGVFGIFENKTTYVAHSAYLALYALQHRGQESCGIAVNDDGVFRHHRGDGLVPDVFTSEKLDTLGTGNMAIGHVRYSTTGGKSVNNIQPLVIRHIKGNLALAHNGNLVNAHDIRKTFELKGGIFHGTSDTESIAYSIVSARLTSKSTEEAIEKIMQVQLHRSESAFKYRSCRFGRTYGYRRCRISLLFCHGYLRIQCCLR